MSHYYQDMECTLRNGMLVHYSQSLGFTSNKKRNDACTHFVLEEEVVADAALVSCVCALFFARSLSHSPNFGSFLPVYGSTVKREAEQRLQRTPSVCQEAPHWQETDKSTFFISKK